MKKTKNFLLLLFLLLFLFTHESAKCQTVYHFDGVDDYAAAPQSGNGILNDFSVPHDFTIEARFKLHTTITDYGSVVAMLSVPADGFILGTDATGTHLRGAMGRHWGYVEIASSEIVALDTWYTIALVYDNTSKTFSFYVDGVEIGSAFLAAPHYMPEKDYAMSFGKSLYWGGETLLDIDFVRVWTNKQSETQLNNNQAIEVDCASSGLLVQYRFDDPSGSTVMEDCTSNNFNGTISGATVVETSEISLVLQNPQSVQEIANSTNALTYCFTRTGGDQSTTLTVNFSIHGEGLTTDDFTATASSGMLVLNNDLTGNITFNATNPNVDLVITPKEDNVVELTEEVGVRIEEF